jgi:hypothetical protein
VVVVTPKVAALKSSSRDLGKPKLGRA